jgi:hypothetical protein
MTRGSGRDRVLQRRRRGWGRFADERHNGWWPDSRRTRVW